MPHPLRFSFSSRTDWDLSESRFAAAIRERRAGGKPMLDLCVSNPTVCGFEYPPEWFSALSRPSAAQYEPHPMGSLKARSVVSGYYTLHDAHIDPAHILLTASTSESYSYLFRLLCNSGDNVLVPSPGYPLFDYLATLDDVQLRTYELLAADNWAIDFVNLRRQLNPRTRAIIVVSPNNPTGHNTSAADRAALLSFCAEHNLVLIVDEVFLDYQIGGRDGNSFAGLATEVPIFLLSGVSKLCALPQMKLGWIALNAPAHFAAEAMARLELIADTFLSVNTPAQHALPTWFTGREAIQSQVLDRIAANLRTLHEASRRQPLLGYLPPEAGWNVLLRIPANGTADDFVESLVLNHGLIVHPGSLYGLPFAGWLVVSTITPEADFEQGIERLIGCIAEESRK